MLFFSSSITSSPQLPVNSFHFQTECCPNSVILIPWLYHCSFIFFWFVSSCFMSFNLQGSHNAPCSSFLTEFPYSFIAVVFFFHFVQPLKVPWFHSSVKEATLFYLPLPFLPGDISRISGRDPLLVWESCDARDRRPRRFQKIPDVPGCPCVQLCLLYLFCVASYHHAIMSYFILHLNLNKLCGPSVHLNRGKVTSLYNIYSQYFRELL